MRTLIAGVPRAGKTTLALSMLQETGARALHTDDLIDLGWSEASELAGLWIDSPGPWTIEGVAVPRALRKWLSRSSKKPADVVLWLDSPRIELTAGQAAMAQACRTVWAEVVGELVGRGVRVERV